MVVFTPIHWTIQTWLWKCEHVQKCRCLGTSWAEVWKLQNTAHHHMTFNTTQDKQNTDREQDQQISVLQSGEKVSIKNNSNSYLISQISPLWILFWCLCGLNSILNRFILYALPFVHYCYLTMVWLAQRHRHPTLKSNHKFSGFGSNRLDTFM